MPTRFCLFALLILSTAVAVRAADTPVDFVRDIQPILNDQCVSCHGAEKARGHLRLDVKSMALDGGTSGKSIELGKGEASLLVHRLRGVGDEDQMPLKKPALPAAQIALFSRWIDEGAQWPDAVAGATLIEAAKHWSYIKPVLPTVPEVKDTAWPKNDIDRFVLAKLESQKIAPSSRATANVLLRRAALDITGLPPSPADIDAFTTDTSDAAYDTAVGRLLASPHYGERQARHWLDNARYADSNGYSQDLPRSIWPYRDWVISAFNADMPFDQFTIEQIAGDMLPNATEEQRIATGFHRNTPINSEGGIDPEQFRIESIMDRVATTSTVFLGTTLACAQCHNHKFDPFSQKEYYEFFAFFNNADEPALTVGSEMTPEQVDALKEKIKRLEDGLEAKIAAWETSLTPEQIARLPLNQQAALKFPADKRLPNQRRAIRNGLKSVDNDFGAMLDEVDGLRHQIGGATTLVMEERAEPRKTTVFIKGDFTRPGDPVTPETPRVLPPINAEKPNRLDLAKWIIDPQNPLTARVIVNRIWTQYFGAGLVDTDNDFGTQGSLPSNPELLDYLATEFIAHGWSEKYIHRLIATSATYQQSSDVRPELADVDPYNKLLARQSRVRLDAEIVRDVALSASGLLAEKVGGPSVYPPIPDGVMSLGQVKQDWPTSKGADRYRRGMYTFTFRNTMHPALASFDAPDAISACTRRLRSNTPLQALNLLNDTAWMEFSRGLASRTLKQIPSQDETARLNFAFRCATSRMPAADEIKILSDLLEGFRANLNADTKDVSKIVGNQTPKNIEPAEYAAWTLTSRALLNLDETITRE